MIENEAALRQMIREAWLDGFQASDVDWNATVPFKDGAVLDLSNPNVGKLLTDMLEYEKIVFGKLEPPA